MFPSIRCPVARALRITRELRTGVPLEIRCCGAQGVAVLRFEAQHLECEVEAVIARIRAEV